MIKWLRNRIIKSFIDDVKKQLPEYKERIEGYWERNKDEIIDFIVEKVTEFIKAKVKF